MVFVTDAAGLVTQLGRQWTETTGQTLTDARNFGWTNVVHPEDREMVRHLVLDAIRLRSGFTVRFRLRSMMGGYVWVLSGAVPSFGPPSETFLGFLGSLMLLDGPPDDIVSAEGALRPSEDRWDRGSQLERAADYLLAAHSLLIHSGRPKTLSAVEAALRRLGEDLAEETIHDPSASPDLH